MTPLTTFIIPTHNRRELLRRAVDSALAQDAPIEIVIVDGGSEDGTGDYLDTLKGYAHVHIEKLRRDPGMIETWRIGACIARTEWIH